MLPYTAAAATSLIGARLHVFELRFAIAATGWALACTSALIFHELFRRGVSRQVLNPIWLVVDLSFVNVGIFATGGIRSPWFIWYLPIAAAAAFASGKRAAHLVSIAGAICYVGVMMLMGQATFFNDVFLLAVTRMLFLFGASYFFLSGIANLQEKRLRIRQLEANEARKVDTLAGDTLHFSPVATFDLTVFANVGQYLPIVSRAPWLRGASARFELGNIFNARPRVHNDAGAAPIGYEPSMLDPLGRTFMITLRKQFLPKSFYRQQLQKFEQQQNQPH